MPGSFRMPVIPTTDAQVGVASTYIGLKQLVDGSQVPTTTRLWRLNSVNIPAFVTASQPCAIRFELLLSYETFFTSSISLAAASTELFPIVADFANPIDFRSGNILHWRWSLYNRGGAAVDAAFYFSKVFGGLNGNNAPGNIGYDEISYLSPPAAVPAR